MSFSTEGKEFVSAGKVRGEVGVSGILIDGVTGTTGAATAGLDTEGLRIGRGIDMGVADFEVIGAAGGDSATTARADSGIAGCSGSADEGGTDSVTSLSCC